MKTNNQMDDLLKKIILLREKKEYELQLLKLQYQLTRESLKPINIIKDSLNMLTKPSEIKTGIISTAVNLVKGYFSKNKQKNNSNS
jgi:hypothetical protein